MRRLVIATRPRLRALDEEKQRRRGPRRTGRPLAVAIAAPASTRGGRLGKRRGDLIGCADSAIALDLDQVGIIGRRSAGCRAVRGEDVGTARGIGAIAASCEAPHSVLHFQEVVRRRLEKPFTGGSVTYAATVL